MSARQELTVQNLDIDAITHHTIYHDYKVTCLMELWDCFYRAAYNITYRFEKPSGPQVLKHLISNVLMVFGGSIASNGVVARDVQTLKDQAVHFIW